MAFSAGLVCCKEGGIFYDFPMSGLPVRINRITSMAGLAAYLSMLGLQKGWMYVDLFVQLQRSQGPRSSLPRRLSRLSLLWSDLFDLPAQPYEFFHIGMADNALALCFANLRLFLCQSLTAGAENHQHRERHHVPLVRCHDLLFWRFEFVALLLQDSVGNVVRTCSNPGPATR